MLNVEYHTFISKIKTKVLGEAEGGGGGGCRQGEE